MYGRDCMRGVKKVRGGEEGHACEMKTPGLETHKLNPFSSLFFSFAACERARETRRRSRRVPVVLVSSSRTPSPGSKGGFACNARKGVTERRRRRRREAEKESRQNPPPKHLSLTLCRRPSSVLRAVLLLLLSVSACL